MQDNDVKMYFMKKYHQQIDKMVEIRNVELGDVSAQKRLNDWLHCFHLDSVKVLTVMEDEESFEGKTNNEVYEKYVSLCIGAGYKTLGKIQLSRFICKWYEYQIITKRTNQGIKRVFAKTTKAL